MKVCTLCKIEKVFSEFSPRADRPGKYLSACKDCRAVYYKNKRPPTNKVKHLCKQDCLRWQKAKRNKRTKDAVLLANDEFNLFFLSEIHDLRRKRDESTKIKWHVDHIIPLRNEIVCGLHYWKNMRLITAKENLEKHNAFYD